MASCPTGSPLIGCGVSGGLRVSVGCRVLMDGVQGPSTSRGPGAGKFHSEDGILLAVRPTDSSATSSEVTTGTFPEGLPGPSIGWYSV